MLEEGGGCGAERRQGRRHRTRGGAARACGLLLERRDVNLTSANATFTITSQDPQATCQGGTYPVTPAPGNVGARNRATVRFPIQFFCSSGNGGVFCEFGATLALQTSCGDFNVPSINNHRLVIE